MIKSHHDNTHITTCLSILKQYKKIHHLSLLITIILFMLLMIFAIMEQLILFWSLLLSSIVVLGLIETFYAIRLDVDLSLLDTLNMSDKPIEKSLASLDQSLLDLHLVSENKAGRSLDKRIQGCFKLFYKQIGLCLLQLILPLTTVIFLQIFVFN
ncbi:MAG: hypothetical protein OQL19_00830 [Gammaproteobacteria bacterium]|nr:hypothetical protein [Gammaproteobacteria bacterium]